MEPGVRTSSSMEPTSSRMGNLMKGMLRMANRGGDGTGMPMVMFMRENGGMILNRGMATCTIPIRTSTRGCGTRGKKMAMENITTIMEPFIRVAFLMAGKMDLAPCSSLMEPE